MEEQVAQYFQNLWRIFSDAGIFVLFGFAVAGLLHVFVSTDMMGRFLGRGRFLPILKASLVGLPLPLCSCGVLPAAIGLRRQGASKGATVSFLISTPETSVDSIAVTYALLDPIMAVFRPIAAFLTALFAGVACDNIAAGDEADAKKETVMHDCCQAHAQDKAGLRSRLVHGARFAFVEMVGDLGKWLLIGIAVAALIMTVFPQGYLENIPGGRVVMMIVLLVVGIPLYICSTASTPLAASLIIAGVSPGAALVFLLVGPATNAAGIAVVSRELGAKTTVVYLASIIVASVLLGLALDVIYDHFVGAPAWKEIGRTTEALPGWLLTAGAVVFAALLLRHFLARFVGRGPVS